MLNIIKKYPISVIISATLLMTIFLSITVYNQLSLLHFINISFYFSSAYIFIGLLLFVTNQGFFDGISYGFRKLYRNKEEHKEPIIPLSELISVSHTKLLHSGIILLLIMLVALWFYY